MGVSQKSEKIEALDPLEQKITAPLGDAGVKASETEDPNATDYSTSFDDTSSDTENCSGMSDNEVESSHLCGVDSFPIDGFRSMFPMRKKKLTSHWRNFIRPLMWRCKWAELKIMEFRSQALKYKRQILRHDKIKQTKSDHSELENLDLKPFPSVSQIWGEKSMKRRKRKRIEDDAADVASLWSQHNLFSYIENKKADQDGSSVIEEFGNPVIPEQNSAGHEDFGIHDDCFKHENNNASDSIGEILQKIEVAQSHVQNMKSRLITVFNENCMKFSSSEGLSFNVACDGQVSPDLSACNDNASSLGALLYEMGDCVVSRTMTASYGEPYCVPDIIESTVCLLSSVDVTMLQPHVGDMCETIMDNVELQNRTAETEGCNSLNGDKPMAENGHEPERTVKGESTKPPQISGLESDRIPEAMTAHEQSRLASSLASGISFPKSKRKRGERKAASGGWNR